MLGAAAAPPASSSSSEAAGRRLAGGARRGRAVRQVQPDGLSPGLITPTRRARPPVPELVPRAPACRSFLTDKPPPSTPGVQEFVITRGVPPPPPPPARRRRRRRPRGARLSAHKYSLERITLPGTSAFRPPSTLILFFVVLFLVSVFTSGTAIPSGIVVPLLVLGGCMGRLVGLLVLQIAEAVCDPHYAAWMAPHFLPLVEWLRKLQRRHVRGGGHGVQLARRSGELRPRRRRRVGSRARCVATIFVIMLMVALGRVDGAAPQAHSPTARARRQSELQVTAEPDFILPIALSVMFAVWVGDKCNHGIYHRPRLLPTRRARADADERGSNAPAAGRRVG